MPKKRQAVEYTNTIDELRTKLEEVEKAAQKEQEASNSLLSKLKKDSLYSQALTYNRIDRLVSGSKHQEEAAFTELVVANGHNKQIKQQIKNLIDKITPYKKSQKQLTTLQNKLKEIKSELDKRAQQTSNVEPVQVTKQNVVALTSKSTPDKKASQPHKNRVPKRREVVAPVAAPVVAEQTVDAVEQARRALLDELNNERDAEAIKQKAAADRFKETQRQAEEAERQAAEAERVEVARVPEPQILDSQTRRSDVVGGIGPIPTEGEPMVSVPPDVRLVEETQIEAQTAPVPGALEATTSVGVGTEESALVSQAPEVTRSDVEIADAERVAAEQAAAARVAEAEAERQAAEQAEAARLAAEKAARVETERQAAEQAEAARLAAEKAARVEAKRQAAEKAEAERQAAEAERQAEDSDLVKKLNSLDQSMRYVEVTLNSLKTIQQVLQSRNEDIKRNIEQSKNLKSAEEVLNYLLNHYINSMDLQLTTEDKIAKYIGSVEEMEKLAHETEEAMHGIGGEVVLAEVEKKAKKAKELAELTRQVGKNVLDEINANAKAYTIAYSAANEQVAAEPQAAEQAAAARVAAEAARLAAEAARLAAEEGAKKLREAADARDKMERQTLATKIATFKNDYTRKTSRLFTARIDNFYSIIDKANESINAIESEYRDLLASESPEIKKLKMELEQERKLWQGINDSTQELRVVEKLGKVREKLVSILSHEELLSSYKWQNKTEEKEKLPTIAEELSLDEEGLLSSIAEELLEVGNYIRGKNLSIAIDNKAYSLLKKLPFLEHDQGDFVKNINAVVSSLDDVISEIDVLKTERLQENAFVAELRANNVVTWQEEATERETVDALEFRYHNFTTNTERSSDVLLPLDTLVSTTAAANVANATIAKLNTALDEFHPTDSLIEEQMTHLKKKVGLEKEFWDNKVKALEAYKTLSDSLGDDNNCKIALNTLFNSELTAQEIGWLIRLAQVVTNNDVGLGEDSKSNNEPGHAEQKAVVEIQKFYNNLDSNMQVNFETNLEKIFKHKQAALDNIKGLKALTDEEKANTQDVAKAARAESEVKRKKIEASAENDPIYKFASFVRKDSDGRIKEASDERINAFYTLLQNDILDYKAVMSLVKREAPHPLALKSNESKAMSDLRAYYDTLTDEQKTEFETKLKAAFDKARTKPSISVAKKVGVETKSVAESVESRRKENWDAANPCTVFEQFLVDKDYYNDFDTLAVSANLHYNDIIEIIKGLKPTSELQLTEGEKEACHYLRQYYSRLGSAQQKEFETKLQAAYDFINANRVSDRGVLETKSEPDAKLVEEFNRQIQDEVTSKELRDTYNMKIKEILAKKLADDYTTNFKDATDRVLEAMQPAFKKPSIMERITKAVSAARGGIGELKPTFTPPKLIQKFIDRVKGKKKDGGQNIG